MLEKRTPKALQENLAKMRTEVKIPFEPAPADPEWMIRKYAGLKLNAEELEQFYSWHHDQQYKRL